MKRKGSRWGAGEELLANNWGRIATHSLFGGKHPPPWPPHAKQPKLFMTSAEAISQLFLDKW